MKIWKKFGNHSADKAKAETIDQVAIFGSSHALPTSELVNSVIAVAKELAGCGYTIVNGGGPGAIRAATIGAKEAGGRVIGVTLEDEAIPDFEGKDPKNMFDKEIKTSNYVERTLTILKQGQVYVIFNGGTGTISEFGMAWGLAKLYFGHHKPLILYGKFWKNIIEAFKKNMILQSEELKVYKIVETPEGVLDAIREFEKEIERGEHGTHLKSDFSI